MIGGRHELLLTIGDVKLSLADDLITLLKQRLLTFINPPLLHHHHYLLHYRLLLRSDERRRCSGIGGQTGVLVGRELISAEEEDA